MYEKKNKYNVKQHYTKEDIGIIKINEQTLRIIGK